VQVEIQRFDPPRELKPLALDKTSRATPMDTAVSMTSLIARGSTGEHFRKYAAHFEDPRSFVRGIRKGARLTPEAWFPRARKTELGMRLLGLIRYKHHVLVVVSKHREHPRSGKPYEWVGSFCMISRAGVWYADEGDKSPKVTDPVIKHIHDSRYELMRAPVARDASPLATQPDGASISPTPASATVLCITDKWILWQTHEPTSGGRRRYWTTARP